MSDEHDLIERLRQRDEVAFVELVRKHHNSLFALARFFVPNRAVAEEVIQDTWMAVLRGIDGFGERSSLKTWLSRIVMNLARTRAVREKRMVPFAQLAAPDLDEAYTPVEPERFQGPDGEYPDHWSVAPRTWNMDPERRFLSDEAMQVVEEGIRALPETQKVVLKLRDIEGWTGEEICNALDLSETNQRVLLHRARSKVRANLEAYFENPGRIPVDRRRTVLQGTHSAHHGLS